MNAAFFNKINENLRTKRFWILDWLQNTSTDVGKTRLGPTDVEHVEKHLQVLNKAIEKSSDHSLGLCTVCHGYVETQWLEMDYTTHVCLDHLSPAEARRLEDELEMSQTIHKALLPQRAPEIPGMDFAVFSRPSEIIGGDFFDFIPFDNGAYGLAIADVAGHGMSSGILMASLQMGLRTLAPLASSPGEVISRLHQLFIHNIHFTTFVSLFLGVLYPKTRQLIYSNAGHNPPLVLHSNEISAGKHTWLRPTGPSIGLIEEAMFNENSIQLHRGDLLLLYTDGVTEASNAEGAQFGNERLAKLTMENANLPAMEIVRSLRNRLNEFTGDLPLADDTTILVCRIDI